MMLSGSGALLSPAHLRSIAKRLDLEVEGSVAKGWVKVSGPNVSVYGNAPIKKLRAIASMSDVYLGVLYFALGGDPERLTFDILVFRNERDFKAQAGRVGCPNAGAYYVGGAAHEIAIPAPDEGSPESLERLLSHEFTHAYVDRVFNFKGGLWFNEGLAEYFSNLQVSNGEISPGAVNEHGLGILRAHRHALIPIRDFMEIGKDTFYGPGFSLHYAQAWAMVRFLFIIYPGAVNSILKGDPIPMEEEDVEKRWSAYLDNMVEGWSYRPGSWEL